MASKINSERFDFIVISAEEMLKSYPELQKSGYFVAQIRDYGRAKNTIQSNSGDWLEIKIAELLEENVGPKGADFKWMIADDSHIGEGVLLIAYKVEKNSSWN